MRKTFAALFLMSAAACSSQLGNEPVGPTDPALDITTQAKVVSSLVIERLSGDCATGITVRVTGVNLSAKSRVGLQWLSKSDNTGFGPAQVELGKGPKKTVEWTEFWPASVINPPTGAKFDGEATGVVTDAWGGWLYNTGPTFIGPVC